MPISTPIVNFPIRQISAPVVPNYDPIGVYQQAAQNAQNLQYGDIRNRLMDMYIREQADKQNFLKLQAQYQQNMPAPTQFSVPQPPMMPPEMQPPVQGIGDRGPNSLLEQNTTPIEQPPLEYMVPPPMVDPNAAAQYPVQAMQYQQEQANRQAAIQKQQADRLKSIVDIYKSIPPKERKKLLPVLGKTIPEFSMFDPDDIIETDQGVVAFPVMDEAGNTIGHAWIDDKGVTHPISDTKDTASIKLIRGALRERLGREPTSSEILQEQINQASEMSGARAMAGIGAAIAKAVGTAQAVAHAYDDQVVKIGNAMIRGEQSPEIKGFGMAKLAAPLKAYLAEQGFDQARAELDWKGVSKRVQTANSINFLRLENAVRFTKDSIPALRRLVADWNVTNKQGQLVTLNQANLALAKEGVFGINAQKAAQAIDTQINDMVAELATVYRGGLTSTDKSLELAAENLRGKWSEPTLLHNIDLIEENLRIREHSLKAIRSDAQYKTGGNVSLPEEPFERSPKFDPTKSPKGDVSKTPSLKPLPKGYTSKASVLKYLKTLPQNKNARESELRQYIDATYGGKW